MPRLLIAALVVTAVLAFVVLVFAGWPADRYRDNDFIGFWSGSRALLEGRDPYDLGVWLDLHERVGSKGLEVVPPHTAYGYPLTTALVFAPFALLPISLAAPAWLVVQAALALAALYALGRTLFATTLRRDLPVLVMLAATSQPIWVLAVGGNLGGFLLAIAASSAALLLADHALLAGAIAGLLVVKPHPLLLAMPLLLLVLPRSRALAFATGVAAVAGTLVLVTLVLRPGWISEWLVPVGRINAAPVSRATIFGLLPPDAKLFGWIAVAAVLAAFAWWSGRRPRLELAIGAAIPLSLFAGIYSWSYDHSVLFVTAAVVLALAARTPDATRTRLLVLLAFVSAPLPWALYATAFSRGEESWSIAVPLAMLATLAIAERETRRSALS